VRYLVAGQRAEFDDFLAKSGRKLFDSPSRGGGARRSGPSGM